MWWSLGGMLFLLFFTAVVQAAVELEEIRYRPFPDGKLRIILDLSRNPRYKAFLLDHPKRLVVDLRGGRLKTKLRPPRRQKVIRRIRKGYPRPKTLRLVFDLRRPVKLTHFELTPKGPYGHRIVLDLKPTQVKKRVPRRAKKRKSPIRHRQKILVAIDAGHGGRDTGAIGRRYHLYEKNVTLAIARALDWLVDRDRRMRGVLIRRGDHFLPLAERVRRAKRLGADLFVSIHADGHHNPLVRGASVFIYNPRRGLRPVAYKKYDPKSLRLAREILQELRRVNRLHFPWVERRRYYVLAGPMPSVLVEVGFITNPREERRLRQKGYRWRIAEAIYRGLRNFVRKHYR